MNIFSTQNNDLKPTPMCKKVSKKCNPLLVHILFLGPEADVY